MKEQLTMSRMMQPRDQTSAFWLKEKLRASGAIQDLWKGSVGRKKGGYMSPMRPGETSSLKNEPFITLFGRDRDRLLWGERKRPMVSKSWPLIFSQ